MAKSESIKLGRGFRVRLRGSIYHIDYHVSGSPEILSGQNTVCGHGVTDIECMELST